MVITRVILLLLLTACGSYGQQAYYLCYFSNKPFFNVASVKPQDHLSQRSLSRRNKNQVSFSKEDYPVHQPYLEEIKAMGIPVKITSKWLNAALVLADETQKVNLETKVFVDSLVLVSRLLKGSSQPKPPARTFETSSSMGEYFVNDKSLKGYFNRGQGVKIAVFDGGFLGVDQFEEFQHLYKENRIIVKNLLANDTNVYQYDDHGTQVLSVLAAVNRLVPQADYELYVTEDVDIETRVEEVYWLRAAEMADSSGVDIINSSLGYSLFHDLKEEDYQLADLDGKTSIITRAANFATSKGMVVVTSIGNEGKEASWNKMNMPADAFDVISVGAVNASGQRADFSSFGPTADGRIKPEIMSLGVAVDVLDENGWTTANGTSFSAPAISGVCALLLQQNPMLTQQTVKQLMIQSGNRYEQPDNEYGYGVLDFELLMSKVPFKVFNPIFYFTNDGRVINFLNADKKPLSIGMYTLDGKVFYQGNSSEALISLPYPQYVPFVIMKLVLEGSSSTFFLPRVE